MKTNITRKVLGQANTFKVATWINENLERLNKSKLTLKQVVELVKIETKIDVGENHIRYMVENLQLELKFVGRKKVVSENESCF